MNEEHGNAESLKIFICDLFLNEEESQKPLPRVTVYPQIHKEGGDTKTEKM